MTIENLALGDVPARVAAPAGTPRGGVVVLHQGPGYTPQTAGWLTRLSDAGYLAVAPLLLHRQGVEVVDPVERFGGDFAAFARFLPGDDAVREDVAAALDHLAAAGVPATATGLVGFSFGGRAAYLVATERELGAAVTFYGGGVQREQFAGNDGIPSLADRTAALRTPWLGLFGEQDFMLAPGELDDWEQALGQVAVATELVRYPDAGHAFDVDVPMGPGMPSPYVAAVSEDATARTMAFLDTSLG